MTAVNCYFDTRHAIIVTDSAMCPRRPDGALEPPVRVCKQAAFPHIHTVIGATGGYGPASIAYTALLGQSLLVPGLQQPVADVEGAVEHLRHIVPAASAHIAAERERVGLSHEAVDPAQPDSQAVLAHLFVFGWSASQQRFRGFEVMHHPAAGPHVVVDELPPGYYFATGTDDTYLSGKARRPTKAKDWVALLELQRRHEPECMIGGDVVMTTATRSGTSTSVIHTLPLPAVEGVQP